MFGHNSGLKPTRKQKYIFFKRPGDLYIPKGKVNKSFMILGVISLLEIYYYIYIYIMSE